MRRSFQEHPGLCAGLLISCFGMAYALLMLAILLPFSREEAGFVLILSLPQVMTVQTILRLCGKRWLPKGYAALFAVTGTVELLLEFRGQSSSPVYKTLMVIGPAMWIMWAQAGLHLLWSIRDGQLRLRAAAIPAGLLAWTAALSLGLGWGVWLRTSGRVEAPWTAESILLLAGFLLMTLGAWVVGMRRIRPHRWTLTDDAALAVIAASVLTVGLILTLGSAEFLQGAAVLAGTLLAAAGCLVFRKAQRKDVS